MSLTVRRRSSSGEPLGEPICVSVTKANRNEAGCAIDNKELVNRLSRRSIRCIHTIYSIAEYLAGVDSKQQHTLILGASPNPERYSFIALQMLKQAGIPISAIGARPAKVEDIQIHTGWDQLSDEPIDTITLYIGADRQKDQYDNILSAKPRRIIFNPGTENPDLMNKAAVSGIEVLEACTLVLLATKSY
jgi:predicted CoA-binding protein